MEAGGEQKKKRLSRTPVDDVKFVWTPPGRLPWLRRKFPTGMVHFDIAKTERLEYAGLSNKEAAARQPADWIKPGMVDVRKVAWKYFWPHRGHLMQFWKGIRPEQAAKLDAGARVRSLARKLGWHREKQGVRYVKYAHFLYYAKKHAFVSEGDLADDNFLTMALRKFREIELGYELLKESMGRRNVFPFAEVASFVFRNHLKTQSKPEVLRAFLAGSEPFRAFARKETDKQAWAAFNSGRRDVLKEHRIHVAHQLLGNEVLVRVAEQAQHRRARRQGRKASRGQPRMKTGKK